MGGGGFPGAGDLPVSVRDVGLPRFLSRETMALGRRPEGERVSERLDSVESPFTLGCSPPMTVSRV